MLTTQNREWGFWGTFSRNWNAAEKETQAAWDAAMKALTAAGYTEEEARVVLDGRLGRHLADGIDNRRKVAATMKSLVDRWADTVAHDAGRNPAADKERTIKLQTAKAKVARCETTHEKAAIAYATAVAGQAPELPRRKLELRRAAIAMVEAIREENSIN